MGVGGPEAEALPSGGSLALPFACPFAPLADGAYRYDTATPDESSI